MDKIIEKLILEALSYGWLGVLTLVLLWDKISKYYRKGKGDYVSWQDLKIMIEQNGKRIDQIDAKLNGHLVQEAQEAVQMERNNLKIEYLEKEAEENKIHRQRLYDMASEIKNRLIEMMSHLEK